MPEHARKAIINYGGIELEVYQLPDGSYTLSRTQVALAIDQKRGNSSVNDFLNTNSPEALSCKDLTINGKEVSIGDGFLTIKPTPFKMATAYWLYYSKKGNAKADALLATGSEEKLTRLADEAFGVKKSEEQYHQESVVNLQQNQQMFSMFNTLLERIEQMDANIKAIAPLVEAGKVATKVYELFPNYEPLFTEVSNSVDNIGLQESKILSEWLYDLGFRDITHGEKITIGRRVSDIVTTGEHDWFKGFPKRGRKRYPEALLPIIKDATLYVLSTRSIVRLIK